MTEETLDALVSQSSDNYVPPFVIPEATAPFAPRDDILGRRAPGTPAELHAEMVRMANEGSIPITSLQQRQRNRGTAGSSYGIPPGLTAALAHGYISPNLPPPAGLVWGHRGGAWVLLPRGG